jgi:predicted nucleic acid-binding protein
MRFLDANILLRYLTRDDVVKADACYALLQRVRSGQEEITTCEAVIAEVVYVLSSPAIYRIGREDIRARLLPILALPGLKLPHKRTYLQALELYVAHPRLDFEDALIVAHMERQHVGALLSYDRDFDRVSTITLQEP